LEETRHDFRLHFVSDRSAQKTLNIPHANPNVLSTVLLDAMQTIVSSGIVISALGRPAFVQGADLVTTEFTEFDVV